MKDSKLRLVPKPFSDRRPESRQADHSVSDSHAPRSRGGSGLRPGPLVRFVRARLRPEERKTAKTGLGRTPPLDYEPVIWRATLEALTAEKRIEHSHQRIRDRYSKIVDEPYGRRETLLRNLPSQLLLTLTYDLIRAGFDLRLDDPTKSLHTAEVAAEAAELLNLDAQIEPHLGLELRCEALMYLGNARRINSDLTGAGQAFDAAGLLLADFTRESPLRADFASLLATLRFVQGRADQAAELLDQEIRARRRLGDGPKRGVGLINRGVVATWSEELDKACGFLAEGVALADEAWLQLLALQALGDRLARDGRSEQALRVLRAAELVCRFVDNDMLRERVRWLRGITHRACGRLDAAERELRRVRERFLERRLPHSAALASMDLICVLAPQARWTEVRSLAEEALSVFRAERLEQRALGTFRLFYEAAQRETLSESLAVDVVNFLVRHQHNRDLRFEPAQ